MALDITTGERRIIVRAALKDLCDIASDTPDLYDEVVVTALKLHLDLVLADVHEHTQPGTTAHTDATNRAATITTMLKEVGEKPWY